MKFITYDDRGNRLVEDVDGFPKPNDRKRCDGIELSFQDVMNLLQTPWAEIYPRLAMLRAQFNPRNW